MATVWHIVSTRPSADIFSMIISFMEKDVKQKKIVRTRDTEQRYRE